MTGRPRPLIAGAARSGPSGSAFSQATGTGAGSAAVSPRAMPAGTRMRVPRQTAHRCPPTSTSSALPSATGVPPTSRPATSVTYGLRPVGSARSCTQADQGPRARCAGSGSESGAPGMPMGTPRSYAVSASRATTRSLTCPDARTSRAEA
ncbi:hypothetical protein GCM10020001_075860 [Nonomuraea salmonea]